jgi:hypothetical protein
MSQLEYRIGEKSYQFLCSQDSPLIEVKEALFQFLKLVGQIEDQVRESQKQQESAPKEEIKTE